MILSTRTIALAFLLLAISLPSEAQSDRPPAAAASEPAPPMEQETAPERPRKDPPGEFRRHMALRSRVDGRVFYEMTEIIRLGDDVEETLLLVSEVGHGSLILSTWHSYKDNQVTYTIADAARNDFIATSFEMPFTSRTRKEVAAESKTNPSLKMLPALLTIKTRTGEWRTTDSEIRDWPRMRELRVSIRQSVPSHLVEAMERMRGTVFAIAAGSIFYDGVARYVVYEDESEPLVPHLEEVTLPPSCAYDKGFGYPCTAEQEARIKAAREAGKPPAHYW